MPLRVKCSVAAFGGGLVYPASSVHLAAFAMPLAVLTYHSNNVLGNDYASNDHVAMAEDLRLLAALNLPVVPLGTAVDALPRNARVGLAAGFLCAPCAHLPRISAAGRRRAPPVA